MDIKNLPKITIEDALGYYGVSAEKAAQFRQSVDVMDTARDREQTMRSLLPAQVVRRLDAGFARSNPVHPDTALALYAFCRARMPEAVYETGTYWGYSTAYMAAALRDNERGLVYTFDIYDKAGKHIDKSLLPWVRLHRGKPSTEMMPAVLATVKPDIFFQDSLHDYEGVCSELTVMKPFFKPDTLVLFHDFIDHQVRQAAADVLTGYDIYVLDGEDDKELGIAVPAGTFSPAK